MANKTAISWSFYTSNPIRASAPYGRHACLMVGPECHYCYASRQQPRFGGKPYEQETQEKIKLLTEAVTSGAIALHTPELMNLIKISRSLEGTGRRRLVFLCSMTDLYGAWVPNAWLWRIWQTMALCPNLTFQVLTKRSRRMFEHLATRGWINLDPTFARLIGVERARLDTLPERVLLPLPNVWLGVSIGMARYAGRAIDLGNTPAAVRFWSVEPMLDDVGEALPYVEPCVKCRGLGRMLPSGEPLSAGEDPDRLTFATLACSACGGSKVRRLVDWVIIGGESGGPPERRLVQPCAALGHEAALRKGSTCSACNNTGLELKIEAGGWIQRILIDARRHGVARFYKQGGGVKATSAGDRFYGQQIHEWPDGRGGVTDDPLGYTFSTEPTTVQEHLPV